MFWFWFEFLRDEIVDIHVLVIQISAEAGLVFDYFFGVYFYLLGKVIFLGPAFDEGAGLHFSNFFKRFIVEGGRFGDVGEAGVGEFGFGVLGGIAAFGGWFGLAVGILVFKF